MAEHKIVLAAAPPAAQGPVAAALAKLFGIELPVAQQIVQGAPIVILDGLAPEQAGAILDAMQPVRQAGGQVVISAASGSAMGKVNWPSPPKVAGRGLETYKPGYVPPPAAPTQVPTPRPPARPPTGAGVGTPTSAVLLRCPHCNSPIRLTISSIATGPLQGPGDTGIRQVPVPVALQDAPALSELPVAESALPEVPNVPGKTESRPPSSSTRVGPMDLEEFERAVGGGKPPPPTGDALLRQLDASLPAKDPGLRALEQGPGPAAPKPPTPPGSARVTPGSITARRLRDRRR